VSVAALRLEDALGSGAGSIDARIDSIYTAAMKPLRAKLFQNGGSQAVRLPKAYRFASQREVLVRREGLRVILEPADEWSQEFRACLGSLGESIPRPKQEKLSRVRNPFD
jgi:virulence-associated protein VagC